MHFFPTVYSPVRFRPDTGKNLPVVRMERHENRLCRAMAAAPTLETFKNRLEQLLNDLSRVVPAL